MELQELVDGFAAACGLADLALDAEGVAVFEADGMLVRISNMTEARAFVLEGEIGDPPVECRDRFEQSLLRLNLSLLPAAGVAIALAENDAYVLQSVCGYDYLSVDAFVDRIRRFLDELERLGKLLDAFSPEAEGLAEAAGSAAEEARLASFGGFVQV